MLTVLVATPYRCPMARTVDEAAGEAIALYRTTRGWTQSGLADLIKARGLSLAQQTIAKIEAGTRPLKLAEAVVLAEVLGVKVDDLLEFRADGVSRLIIDFWSDELTSAQHDLDAAVGRLARTEVSAASIVVRGRNGEFRSQVESLRKSVGVDYDFDQERFNVQLSEAMSIPDAAERVATWELLGFDGDPAS